MIRRPVLYVHVYTAEGTYARELHYTFSYTGTYTEAAYTNLVV